MGRPPQSQWATASDGVQLAYQVYGDGPVDIVVIPPFAQNIELLWERPEMRHIFERTGRFARVVHFDKRGTGCSDRTVAVPSFDQRVDDTRAVMDAAGIERCVLHGVSEGGPMAILFAVTYPSRVDKLILHATDARLRDLDADTPEARERRRWRPGGPFHGWGTPECQLLRFLAPTAWNDPDYRAWEPRYERQSATPAALRELLAMVDEIDVRAVLDQIAVPTLVLHVREDPVIPIARARATAAAIRGAVLVEHDGIDHFPHVGAVDWWLDAIERFVTGHEPSPSAAPAAPSRPEPTRITTFGGFEVAHAGVPLPLSAWGSRRARTLCKRLAAAAGQPVPRDELIELLWPDDDSDPARLSARFSVQLSTVRRLLGGGVIADRDSVRLDGREVQVDVIEFERAVHEGRLEDAVCLHRGEFLPEDIYGQWAIAPRERWRASALAALRALAARHADAESDADAVIVTLQQLLALDRFDLDAHHRLVTALHRGGRMGEARRAHERYAHHAAELGLEARTIAAITGTVERT